MNLFKKSAKAFTTWRSSLKSSSESKQKKHDDYTDAMAYLKERVRQTEYEEALRRINPSMTHPAMNATASIAGHSVWPGQQIGPSQGWTPSPMAPLEPNRPTRQFSVEKVDNGFILRSGRYSKICKDMEELSDQFVAIMVEAQLDK